jgi:hypothetical protein
MLACLGLPSTTWAKSPISGTTGISSALVPVALLDLRFSDSSQALRVEVEKQITRALAKSSYRLILGKAVSKRLKEHQLTRGCHIGPCLRRIGRVLGVRRVLIGSIYGEGSSYDIVLTMVDTESGTTLSQSIRRCDVCNFSDVGTDAAKAADNLSLNADRFVRSQGWLRVETSSQKTEVLVDGVPIGTGSRTLLLAPGLHQVSASPPGAAPINRLVRIYASQTTRLRLRQQQPVAAPIVVKPIKDHTIRWPAWLALAGGTSLAAAGSVLLALDEDCPRGACTDRRNTRSIGIGMLIGGALATTAAGLLLYFTQPSAQDEKDPTSASKNLQLGLSAGAGQLGFAASGRF